MRRTTVCAGTPTAGSPISRRRFLGATAALGLSARRLLADDAEPPVTSQGLIDADRDAIRQRFATFMNKWDVPGLSFALARDGRLAALCTIGYANRETKQPVEPRHLFRVASISKCLTSAAVMKLMEDGALTLDQPVFGPDGLLRRYQFASTVPHSDWLHAITVRHLLEHTAGGWAMGEDDPMFAPQGLSFPHARLIPWTVERYPLEHEPGSAYAYSNFGYCLLGRVIETLSPTSYVSYVREHILKPSGIENMHIGRAGRNGRRTGEVVYYGQGNDPYGRVLAIPRMDSHGGWIASAGDVVRFALHVDGSPEPADILSPDTIDVMATPSAANANYAKGWSVDQGGTWWHLGAMDGSAATVVRTAGGLCTALLVNTWNTDDLFLAEFDRLPYDAAADITEWLDGDLFDGSNGA